MVRRRNVARASTPSARMPIVAGSGTAATADEAVPAKLASNGAMVLPMLASAGVRLDNARLKLVGAIRSDAGSIDDDNTSVSGGLDTFTTKPVPPAAPKAASVNVPDRISTPPQFAALLMQNVPE